MINTAPEENIEKWSAGAPEGVKEYVPWKINIEEEKQEDTTELDEKIENAEEWNQWWNENKKVLHEIEHTTQQKIPDWFNKQAEEFTTKHPDQVNRIPAAKDFIEGINEQQKKWNIVGRWLKRVLKGILWKDIT